MARPLNGTRMGRTDLLIVLVIVLWAVNLSVIKIGLRSLSPHAFNAIRLSLASLAYLAVLLARPGRLALANKGDRWKAAGLGLLGITFYQVFFIKAVSMMNASTASIIMGTSPIFIALLATAVGEERISPGRLDRDRHLVRRIPPRRRRRERRPRLHLGGLARGHPDPVS